MSDAEKDIEYGKDLIVTVAARASKLLVTGGKAELDGIVCNTSGKYNEEAGILIINTLVDPKYVGRVIGRDGKNAKAIRQLIYCIGKMRDLEVQYKVDAVKTFEKGEEDEQSK